MNIDKSMKPPPSIQNPAGKSEMGELTNLLRDLHRLLASYAPLWYTEDLDSRTTEMLARFPVQTHPDKTASK